GRWLRHSRRFPLPSPRPWTAHVPKIRRADAMPGVEALEPRVILVDHPENLTRTKLIGKIIDPPQQRFARPSPARFFKNEEILEEQGWTACPCERRAADIGKADCCSVRVACKERREAAFC